MKIPWTQADHEDMNEYRPMSDAPIICAVHGKHMMSVFHYPSTTDKRTYYTCRLCFEDHFGVELKQRKNNIVLGDL